MKLNELAAAETTTFELLHPTTNEPLNVFITAHTPDSSEWVRMEKKFATPGKKQSLILAKGKGEGHRIELDADTATNRMKVIIAMVTNIEGIEDFSFSKAAVEKLLNNQTYHWMYEQLDAHLSDRANYFLASKPPAKSTAKA